MEDRRERAKSLFRQYDPKGTGVVDSDDFVLILNELGSFQACEIEALFASVDENQGGSISYDKLIDRVYEGTTRDDNEDARRSLGQYRFKIKAVDRAKESIAQSIERVELVLFNNESQSWLADNWTIDVPWLRSPEIPGRLRSLKLSCSWKDHGWGDGYTGCVRLALYQAESELVSVVPFGVIGFYRRAVGNIGFCHAEATLDGGSPFVREARAGDHFRVFVDVGGAKCELCVEAFTCVAEVIMVKPLLAPLNGSSGYAIAPADPSDSAHLQLVEATFPFQGYIELAEHRGITIGQLEKVVEFVSAYGYLWRDLTPANSSRTSGMPLTIDICNLYHTNSWVILPATKKKDCALVELLSGTCQKPDFFISHWWGEIVADFWRCIRSHSKTRCLSDDTKYWVCAYANRQHSLSSEISIDPKDTSFYKAMMCSSGVLLVLDDRSVMNNSTAGPATPFTRMWCCYEEYLVSTFEQCNSEFLFDIVAATKLEAPVLTSGLAKVDLSHSNNTPSFWKARRESSFPLEVIRSALQVDVSTAQATREEDSRHIRNAIAQQPLDDVPPSSHCSYDKVNRYLRASFAIPCWRQILEKGLLTELELPRIIAEDDQRVSLKLNLSGSAYSRPTEGLSDALRGLRELMDLSLDLSKTTLTSEDMTMLSATLGATHEKSLSQLSLDLSHCKVALRDLAPAFQLVGLVNLRLSLAGEGVLEGLRSFARWLPDCGPLRKLELEFSSCRFDGLAASEWHEFSDSVAQLKGLEACSLGFDFIGGETIGALSALCASLRSLTKLKSLSLKYFARQQTNTHSWLFDGRGDAFGPEMEELSLVLFDSGAETTAGFDALGAMKKLRRLSVDMGENRQISSLEGLWTGLTCNNEGRSNLQDLTLRFDGISVRMPRFLFKLPSLRCLTLQLAPVTFKQLAEEIADLPRLKQLALFWESYNDCPDPLFAAVGRLRDVEDLSLSFRNAANGSLDLHPLFASSTDGGLGALKKLELMVQQGAGFAELKGVGSLAKGILCSPSLRELNLDFDACYAKPGQSKCAAEQVAALTDALESISLEYLRVSFRDCFQLPKALQNEFFSIQSLKQARRVASDALKSPRRPCWSRCSPWSRASCD